MTARWIFSATAFVAAVLLVRALLGRRLGARLRYGLWLLVLARLLLPGTVGSSAWSPANLARPLEGDMVLFGPVVTGLPGDMGVYEGPDGGLLDANSAGWTAPDGDGTVTRFLLALEAPGRLRSIWLGGMAVTTAWFLLCNLLFWRRLRRTRTALEAGVYLADVPAPCAFGLVRPAVYVTRAAAADPARLDYVLRHERAHLRQGDHVWALLRTAAVVLWWFHPLVWVAARLSRLDGELCCDDAVLRQLPEEARTAYGQTLLDLARGDVGTTAFCAASTLSRRGRQLRRRLLAVAGRLRPRRWAMVLAAVLLAGATLCAFAGPAEVPEAPADVAAEEPTDAGAPARTAEQVAAAFRRMPPEEGAVLAATAAAGDGAYDLQGAALYTVPGDGMSFHIAFLVGGDAAYIYPVGVGLCEDGTALEPWAETFRYEGDGKVVVTARSGEAWVDYGLTYTREGQGSVRLTAETPPAAEIP